jgi:uncharacterized repeat protein (TIGR03803 family)
MWFIKLRRQWFGKALSRRREARVRSAAPRVRQLETRLTPSLVVLGSFDGTDGKWPEGGVVIDSGGNVYGTTEAGGSAGGGGTIFEVANGSGQVTQLAEFGGGTGYEPRGGLIADSAGDLFGTTEYGGPFSRGTVFELVHGSSTITRLAAFDGANGEFPLTGLIMDSSGNLYGTAGGGASNDGTVFEVAHGSGRITTLASFDGTDGSEPLAGLVMDSSGNLYGTTNVGGAFGTGQGYGTVFEVVKGSGTITSLASFNGTDGAYPGTGLAMDSGGDLYGATNSTIFELAHGSGTITTLAPSSATSGTNLLMDSGGNLYGTYAGTIFELFKGRSKVTTIASFKPLVDGLFPNGLTMDSKGDLYGVCTKGGPFGNKLGGDGTVFELPAAVTADQWTGANNAVDTNWSDGANWSFGTPPTARQVAVFTNNPSVQSFTATVDAGFTNSIGGLLIDGSWGGTITVNSPLSVTGDLTLGSGSISGSAAVTIAGHSSAWTGGQIDLGSGGFTNLGTLTTDTTAGNLVATGAGTLTNDGTIYEAGTNSLVLENGATLSNASGGTFDLTNDGGVSQSGGGTFSNPGTLEKTGGTGTSTIATTTLDNTGTVAVSSGTLDVAAAVPEVAGSTLKAGHWKVTGSAAVAATLDITSAGNFTTLGARAAVTLDGPNTTFTNLISLTTIKQGGRFTLLGGQSFTTAGALTNNGSVTLSPGSILTVSGSFTQSSTGALALEMGGTDAAPTVGMLFSTSGTVALAGSLTVTSTVVPAVATVLTILENEGNSPISGEFAELPEAGRLTFAANGTTMVFQISYVGAGTYGNNNVTIERIL